MWSRRGYGSRRAPAARCLLAPRATGGNGRCRDRRGHKARCKHTRSEEHTSELQSLMRISYAVFCLKKKTTREKPRRAQIKDTHIESQTHYAIKNSIYNKHSCYMNEQ